jgi:hypothetical protein
MKRGERTGARGPLPSSRYPPPGHNESPASLPFSSFYSSAKEVGASHEAVLPNSRSSLPQKCLLQYLRGEPLGFATHRRSRLCEFFRLVCNYWRVKHLNSWSSLPVCVCVCVCVCVGLHCYNEINTMTKNFAKILAYQHFLKHWLQGWKSLDGYLKLHFTNAMLVVGAGVGQSVQRPRTGRPGDRGSIPGRVKSIFPLASVSRPALGPTQPPVQWVSGVLSPGVNRGRGVTLTTYPHVVPTSWMSRS